MLMNGGRRRRRKRRRTDKEVYGLIVSRTPWYPNVNNSHYIFYNLKQSKYLCTVVCIHLSLCFSQTTAVAPPVFSFFAPISSYPLFLSFSFSYLPASVSSQWFNGRKRNYLCRRAADRRDRVALGLTQKERERQRERHETLGEWRIR